jgi:hypothetical protein
MQSPPVRSGVDGCLRLSRQLRLTFEKYTISTQTNSGCVFEFRWATHQSELELNESPSA